MKSSGFPNLMNGNRYINQFDFPTINEAYRGKEVMYNALLLGGYENVFVFLHQLYIIPITEKLSNVFSVLKNTGIF